MASFSSNNITSSRSGGDAGVWTKCGIRGRGGNSRAYIFEIIVRTQKSSYVGPYVEERREAGGGDRRG